MNEIKAMRENYGRLREEHRILTADSKEIRKQREIFYYGLDFAWIDPAR